MSDDTGSYQTALAWLLDRINYESLAAGAPRYRFTLDRMRELARRLGHQHRLATDSPQTDDAAEGSGDTKVMPVVHIAGTKGKGSTATMVAAMLTQQGFRTGLYTSPHLAVLEERFRVDGRMATRDELVALVERIRPIVDSMADDGVGRPSFFELTTGMAIEHFHRRGCDAWVLETGLGGRLDSTNVFQSTVTAITSIGLDHQHVLGDTVEKIAAEKAGIFKPGVPAIHGVPPGPAADVIAAAAVAAGASLKVLGQDFDVEMTTEQPNWGSRFTCRGLEPRLRGDEVVELNLDGDHQVRNAAVSLAIVAEVLAGSPRNATVATGATTAVSPHFALTGVSIEARLERFAGTGQDGRPIQVLLDAAHNVDSITALCRVVQRRFNQFLKVVVFGTSTDKNAGEMLRLLDPLADQFVLTRYLGNPRYVPLDELRRLSTQNLVSATSDRVSFHEDPVHACQHAITSLTNADRVADSRPRLIVVCGSFFLAAEVRPFLREWSRPKIADDS